MPDNIPKVPSPTSANKRPKASRQARGYDGAHFRLRQIVLAEQPICASCKANWSNHMHHLNHDNQDRRRENVVGLCAACHMRYHADHRKNN
jgi:hypothetical protein